MNSYATMFASYLKEVNLQFQTEHTEECDRIVIDDDVIEIDDSSCKFLRLVTDVPPNKMDEMFRLVNRLNEEYRYVGFYIYQGNPSLLCASYYFSIYGSEKETSDQILKKYNIFRKSLANPGVQILWSFCFRNFRFLIKR
ncbi:MAG: YbjN domain-containing protein [Oscillospiraceae bacterium]|nr:YbjN domain-containing protein [Oscillospiraceae bacterium]